MSLFFQKRQAEREAARAAGETDLLLDVVFTPKTEDTVTSPVPAEDKSAENNYDDLKQSLFDTIQQKDVQSFMIHYKRVKDENLDLGDPRLRLDDGTSVFFVAVEEKVEEIRDLLMDEAPYHVLCLEKTIPKGKIQAKKTPLHLLAEWGDLENIRKLLKRIPDEEKKDFLHKTLVMEPEGQRPRPLDVLQIAALCGHTQLVEYLVVDMKMDVNQTNVKNDTAVLWAARANHIDTVRRLIQLGANLMHQNDKGSTPLYWACRYGLADMAKVLMSEGKADVHQRRKLGLVSPIVLTAAMGYRDITEMLLDHGADVNTEITSGFTPLHHAAANGNVDTIQLLVERGADINSENIFGETALLRAAHEQETEAVLTLATLGADLGDLSKDGKSVWHYAIEAPDKDLLKTVIACHKKANACRLLVLPKGRNALHLAALKGDLTKVELLLSAGVSAEIQDDSGNTFFHLAARADQQEIVERFIDQVDVNAVNTEAETALFFAVRCGHTDIITILLKKSNLKLKNSSGETVLHLACRCPETTPELVQMIVDMMIKAHDWGLVNSQDIRGNTALHVAARTGRVDLLPCLRNLSLKAVNHHGDTPPHVAARQGEVEFLKAIPEHFRNDLNIDQRNETGASMLHVAASLGDVDIVKVLIESGANMALRDQNGNTVLHMLVTQIVRYRGVSNVHLQVFQLILDNVVRWWCIKDDIAYPDEDSELYFRHRKKAIIHLTCELLNDRSYSVLLYASKEGAKEVFELIMRLKEAYMFIRDDDYTFDVTNLIPETNSAQSVTKLRVKPNNWVAPLMDAAEEISQMTTPSCLDLIVRVDRVVVANQMLDIVPMRQLVSGIWNRYQYIYGLIMLMHIAYMVILCNFAIPQLPELVNAREFNATALVDAEPIPYVFLLIWPIILFVYELYYGIHASYTWCMEVGRFTNDKQWRKICTSPIKLLQSGFKLIMSQWSHWASMIFSVLILIWFIMYLVKAFDQVYFLSLGVILGWINTVAFTDGFEGLHSYTIILKTIFLRDILKFLMIYMTVLLGFSYGFQAMLWTSPDLETHPRSIWNYFFTVFNLMVGMGDFFEGTGIFKEYGHQDMETMIKLVYVVYIILTTIILLNLLVAMMTDSYADVTSNEGTTWRVNSVRLALQIEKSMPFLPKLFRFLGIKKMPISYDLDEQRWFMTLESSEVNEIEDKKSQDDVANSLKRIEKELESLTSSVDEIYATLGTVSEAVARARPGSGRGNWSRLRRRVSTLHETMDTNVA